jgi:hypothetical protein
MDFLTLLASLVTVEHRLLSSILLPEFLPCLWLARTRNVDLPMNILAWFVAECTSDRFDKLIPSI